MDEGINGLMELLNICMDSMLSVIKRQVFHWNLLKAILPKFRVAFRTQYNAVFSCISPAILFGFTPSWIESIYTFFKMTYVEQFATSSTNGTMQRVTSRLPDNSVRFLQCGTIHKDSPLLPIWNRTEDGTYWYNVNGKWTGIFILKVTHLYIAPTKPINLKFPVYRILFHPNCDAGKGYHLVDQPTLAKAKNQAESYYKEWLSVNTGT
jgi:hypothetical protein